jgi:aminopeptidase-like protein
MSKTEAAIGQDIHALAQELFPICRSITGDGVRQTLEILRRELPALQIIEVPSGSKAFDWTVPPEWNIRDAYILDPEGRKIVDFAASNLHVVGYSTPVDRIMPLAELQEHLHSLPDDPDAIPYITSYYRERWGFCLTDNQLRALVPGDYRAVIDCTLQPGHLSYGELIIPGDTEDEIFLSTYVCHPSLANNELSGPTVTCQLAKWITGLAKRRHTFRIVFIPETIGSLVYLSRNLESMKKRVRAGFNITCIGDDRAYSYLPSRQGDSAADRTALHVLEHMAPNFERYSYLDRGSDERQYCSPGIDLPVCTVMRSKYNTYPEYHTSHDDLTLVTPAGLEGGFLALKNCITVLENNDRLQCAVLGEPQLGKRGLYPTLSAGPLDKWHRSLMNVLAYCDGKRDLLAVAEVIGEPMWELLDIVELLKAEGLLHAMALPDEI